MAPRAHGGEHASSPTVRHTRPDVRESCLEAMFPERPCVGGDAPPSRRARVEADAQQVSRRGFATPRRLACRVRKRRSCKPNVSGGDVLLALALPLLAACSSDPAADDRAARVCPSKATTATLPGRAGGAALTPVPSFGDNPGALKMYVHAPASGKASIKGMSHGVAIDPSAGCGTAAA